MASEIEKSNVLEDLPNRILCTPVEDRHALFAHLSALLSSSDINTVVIRNVCKILAMTLTKYKDTKSQLLVRNLIIDLLKYHHDATIESIMAVFKVLSYKELANAPVHKASKAALLALGWTSLLNKYGDIESNVLKTEVPRLIEYQTILYQIVISSSNERLTNLANNVLIDILERGYFEKYMSVLLKKDITINVIVFMTILITLRREKHDIDTIANYKIALIDSFVKGIINAKTKPHISCVLSCKTVMNSVTKDDFQYKILPPMQRSMLRNPEVVLEAVGQIFREIQIDLSSYALALGKVLIQYLHSKNEVSRLDSVECLKQLSIKCSDIDVISKLLKEVFAILDGIEGKITIAEYRINLLQVCMSQKLQILTA